MQAENSSNIPDFDRIEPVYLFVGDSAYMVEEAWRKLSAAALPKGSKTAGERVRAKETTAGQVIGRLSTLPMFGGKKLLMLEGVEAWGKEDRGALEAFVPRIAPSACLVLTASGKKGMEGLVKAVEARGRVVQLRPPAERDAPRWLIDKARENGKMLSFRAAFRLVELTGPDLNSLSTELEKLCLLVGERDNIEPEDVDEAASSRRGASMFELLDQVKARQAAKALKSLKTLVLSGEAPLKILSSLAWQIRTTWQVKDGLRQGMTEAQIAARLKAHPYVVKKARDHAARFSDSDLNDILDAIRLTDVALKSTGSPPELLMESLLLRLCLEKKMPSDESRGH
jgi:DNA polymerase III subunit delta